MTLIAHDEVGRARKQHRCDWCNETIAVGEPYVRQRCKDGADVWTWRAHAECYRASNKLDEWDLENAVGVTFTRGCTCEKGQHDAGAKWPCGETPLTQETAKEPKP